VDNSDDFQELSAEVGEIVSLAATTFSRRRYGWSDVNAPDRPRALAAKCTHQACGGRLSLASRNKNDGAKPGFAVAGA
jgi:hypothetical protein